jgi:hypothetical protein
VQQVWGLHANPDAWLEAEDALNDLCRSLCPADLRNQLADSASTLRGELALPMDQGGLGIALARASAPVMAARLWTEADARRTGARGPLLREAFRTPLDSGIPGARPAAISTEAFAKAQAVALAAHIAAADRRLFTRRRDLNCMRGGTWVFDGVPWARERHLADVEWDVAWRLAFGGLTQQQRARIDAPEEGFAWRGRVAELALKRAVEDEVPPVLHTWE